MSEQPKDGGAAFPFTVGDPSVWHCEGGMTMRDYFAAAALPAIISLDSSAGLSGEVADAYLYADAMLAEREKGAQP